MESNPGDGKACKLKAFVALPEALLMPEKISVTVTDLRRTTNISLFPDGGIKRQHSCWIPRIFHDPTVNDTMCDGIFMKNEIVWSLHHSISLGL